MPLVSQTGVHDLPTTDISKKFNAKPSSTTKVTVVDVNLRHVQYRQNPFILTKTRKYCSRSQSKRTAGL